MGKGGGALYRVGGIVFGQLGFLYYLWYERVRSGWIRGAGWGLLGMLVTVYQGHGTLQFFVGFCVCVCLIDCITVPRSTFSAHHNLGH